MEKSAKGGLMLMALLALVRSRTHCHVSHSYCSQAQEVASSSLVIMWAES